MYIKATYTLNIFIAYHPADQEQFEELREHLRDLNERNKGYLINKVWSDGSDLSEEGRATIRELTEAADLVLLLMSDNSILSPFFLSEELKYTLEQHEKERSIVVPIILNTCWWEDTAYKDLPVLPRAGLPIYDSANVKNQLFDQVIDELDKKLMKVRKRKQTLEENFDAKIEAAEAIFKHWQKKPESLRAALPLYQQAKAYWREGFAPDKQIIEARIGICHREIDFNHYAKAAYEAYQNDDYQTCYFNCKDALDLRSDARIYKLYKEVADYLEKEKLEKKKAPYEKYLKRAQKLFLALEWKKAEEAFALAIEHHQEAFEPSLKVLEHKVEICHREYVLESSLNEADRLYGIQNYQRMAEVLLKGIEEINHTPFYKIDYALKLVGYLENVTAFRDHRTDKWGFKDTGTDNVIIAPKYTAAYNFTENLAGVKKWDKWGFIDIEGNEIIPFQYDYVSSFQNGIAQVIVDNDTWCINHKGEQVAADIIIKEVPIDPDKDALEDQKNNLLEP